MTRVLFVTRSLQTAPGGMQTATRLLLDALRAQPELEIQVVGWGGPKWALPGFFLKALIVAVGFNGDVVHFGDAVFAPVIGCLKLVRPGLRVTCTVHGLDVTYPNALHQFLLGNLRRCDHISAVSHATAQAVIDRGVAADRVTIIPWGVPVAALAERIPGPPTLLSVGRLIPRKGTAWFIEHVVPMLVRQHPDLRYAVVGDGPQMEHLQSLIAALSLGKNVQLRGMIDDTEKEKLYAQSDILVMPNIEVSGDMEGFGMACIEAAARGVPTVAARLEGIADAIIDDETGTFFEAGDSASAALILHNVLAHAWDRLSVQHSCRKHYDIATVAVRYATELFAPANDRRAHR